MSIRQVHADYAAALERLTVAETEATRALNHLRRVTAGAIVLRWIREWFSSARTAPASGSETTGHGQ